MQITYTKFNPIEVTLSPELSAKIDKYLTANERWYEDSGDKKVENSYIAPNYGIFGYLQALAENGDAEAATFLNDVKTNYEATTESIQFRKPRSKKAKKTTKAKSNKGLVVSSGI